jgi:hypothetical protein
MTNPSSIHCTTRSLAFTRNGWLYSRVMRVRMKVGCATTLQEQEQHFREIAKQLREVERASAMNLLARHQISEGVLRTLQHELDVLDLRASGV